jgi:uncharacterized protein
MFDLSLSSGVALFTAGIFAGIANAIAGGGTLFTFPVFLATGLPPVIANASNAVSVWPGHALATIGYRNELMKCPYNLRMSVALAIAGGATGAILLSIIGNSTLAKLIPFLLLFATALFIFGPTIKNSLSQQNSDHSLHPPKIFARLCEYLFSVYGGFFGAGFGIMLMAGLLILGVNDTQQNNAIKNLLATIVTSIAVIILMASGLVAWPHTVVAFLGAAIGGLIGARIARRLSSNYLRLIVIMVGFSLTLYYFIKYYA